MTYYQYTRLHPNVIQCKVWEVPLHQIHTSDNGYIYLDIRRDIYDLQ